jgi:5-methyltetrahydrofolate--homocysteine methyltransferase
MREVRLIGELMNHSFRRARKAWEARDVEGYAALARLQAAKGADFLTVNIDGTQSLQVSLGEMVAFLPSLVPALQRATAVPLAFDNPSLDYHRAALAAYDRSRSPAPILNSLAASREHLDAMVDLVREFDTRVIVMASEKFSPGGGSQCRTAREIHETARAFVARLVDGAGRTPDQILIDPGLAPVGADTYGLVNMGLDAMRLIRKDPDLRDVHLTVGLTNFSFGIPPGLRAPFECAYLTLAVEAGLDFVLANPEKDLRLLDASDPLLRGIRAALEHGRPQDGEEPEEAGFRQIEKVLELCR